MIPSEILVAAGFLICSTFLQVVTFLHFFFPFASFADVKGHATQFTQWWTYFLAVIGVRTAVQFLGEIFGV